MKKNKIRQWCSFSLNLSMCHAPVDGIFIQDQRDFSFIHKSTFTNERKKKLDRI